MKGNFILKANFALLNSGRVDDKNIGSLFRTSLDTESSHVIGIVHRGGLTYFQYRRTKGAIIEG